MSKTTAGKQGGAPNPIQMQKYLKGVDYPADKQSLVNRAKDNGADQKVMEALQGLPNQQYNRPTDVTRAMSGKKEV